MTLSRESTLSDPPAVRPGSLDARLALSKAVVSCPACAGTGYELADLELCRRGVFQVVKCARCGGAGEVYDHAKVRALARELERRDPAEDLVRECAKHGTAYVRFCAGCFLDAWPDHEAARAVVHGAVRP